MASFLLFLTFFNKIFMKIFAKYLSNLSALQTYQFIRYGSLMLISILFTKTHLSVSEIGNYEVFMNLAAISVFFWVNAIIPSLLTLFHRNKTFLTFQDSEKSAELFHFFLSVIFLSLFSAVSLYFLRNFLSEFLYEGKEIFCFEKLILYVFLSNPSCLIEYIYLLKNRPSRILFYGIFSFSLQIFCVIIPLFLGYSLEKSIDGLIFISLFRFVWLIFLVKKFSYVNFSISFFREIFISVLPLLTASLLTGSANYINDFILLKNLGNELFAIYKYGAKEFPLVLLVATAFANANISEVSRKKENWQEMLSEIGEKSKKFMHVLFPITLFFLVSSHFLYPKIFNHYFEKSAEVFNLYLLLIVSRLIFPQIFVMGLQKNKIILFSSIIELILSVFCTLIFIDIFGILSAAIAVNVANFFGKFVMILYLQIRLKVNFQQYTPLRIWFFYSFLTIFIYLTISFLY